MALTVPPCPLGNELFRRAVQEHTVEPGLLDSGFSEALKRRHQQRALRKWTERENQQDDSMII